MTIFYYLLSLEMYHTIQFDSFTAEMVIPKHLCEMTKENPECIPESAYAQNGASSLVYINDTILWYAITYPKIFTSMCNYSYTPKSQFIYIRIHIDESAL